MLESQASGVPVSAIQQSLPLVGDILRCENPGADDTGFSVADSVQTMQDGPTRSKAIHIPRRLASFESLAMSHSASAQALLRGTDPFTLLPGRLDRPLLQVTRSSSNHQKSHPSAHWRWATSSKRQDFRLESSRSYRVGLVLQIKSLSELRSLTPNAGDGSTGALLAKHMRISKISFTGSIATGRKIQQAATQSNLKRVTLELGGKSPAIVFEDAAIDEAVFWSTIAITANTGGYRAVYPN